MELCQTGRRIAERLQHCLAIGNREGDQVLLGVQRDEQHVGRVLEASLEQALGQGGDVLFADGNPGEPHPIDAIRSESRPTTRIRRHAFVVRRASTDGGPPSVLRLAARAESVSQTESSMRHNESRSLGLRVGVPVGCTRLLRVLAEPDLEGCSFCRRVDPVVVSERSRSLPFAATALVAWALDQPGVEKIVAACDADNAASLLTLDRVGFRRTGEADGRVHWELRRGVVVPVVRPRGGRPAPYSLGGLVAARGARARDVGWTRSR